MKGQKTLFSSASEEWATPQELFDKLNEEFCFTLDPCATQQNHKCEQYFTKEQDGLKMDWGGALRVLQSAIRSEPERVGKKVLHGRTERRDGRCHADPGADRYAVFSRLHTAQIRSALHPWAAEIRERGKRRAVPVDDCYIPRAGNVRERQWAKE